MTDTHRVITTELIASGSNRAVFVNPELDSDLYRDGTFESPKFAAFPKGTKLVVTFRVSKTSRYLMSVDNVFDPVSGADPAEPPVIDIKPPTKRLPGEWWGQFFMTDEKVRGLNIASKIAEVQGAINLRFSGQSGYGKSKAARAFADQTGRGFLQMNCGIVRDPEEWFAYREARDGSTVLEPTAFSEAVQRGNMVILLDEANRLEAWLANSLFSILDDNRSTIVHNTEVVVGPNTVFILTVNEGYQYVGTFEMDMALKNRVHMHFEFEALPPEIESELLQQRTFVSKEDADAIVNVMTRFRTNETAASSVDVTTRPSINIGLAMAGGMTLREAVEYTIIRSIPANQRKGLTDLANSILGTLSAIPLVTGDVAKVRCTPILGTTAQKIAAIKAFRAITNANLSDAKAFIEGFVVITIPVHTVDQLTEELSRHGFRVQPA